MKVTKGYSGADLNLLCKEAIMIPIRELDDIEKACEDDIREINIKDIITGLENVKKTVRQEDLERYVKWNESFGSFKIMDPDT